MAWQDNDNPKQRGKIDRINVSLTETWELSYFVDKYLSSRNYGVTEENRKKVVADLQDYPGSAPFKRADLEAHLDRKYNRTR